MMVQTIDIVPIYQRDCESKDQKQIYPITTAKAVLLNEGSLAEVINHYYIAFKDNSRKLTRLQITSDLRHKGLFITYINTCQDSRVVTEYYNADDLQDNAWGNDDNWIEIGTKQNVIDWLSCIFGWCRFDNNGKITEGTKEAVLWEFATQEQFTRAFNAGLIDTDKVVFIKDSNLVYSNGTFYSAVHSPQKSPQTPYTGQIVYNKNTGKLQMYDEQGNWKVLKFEDTYDNQ